MVAVESACPKGAGSPVTATFSYEQSCALDENACKRPSGPRFLLSMAKGCWGTGSTGIWTGRHPRGPPSWKFEDGRPGIVAGSSTSRPFTEFLESLTASLD